MASVNAPVVSFTGGVIGKLLMNRVDTDTYAQSAEEMENFRALPQGGMSRRPPMEYLDSFTDHAKKGLLIPFVYDNTQSYVILATSEGFDFFLEDGKITSDAVTATIANGDFTDGYTDLADAATITASGTTSGSVANLVDELLTTFHQTQNDSGVGDHYHSFDMGSAVTLYSIVISSGTSNADRLPLDFTIEGSVTGAWAGEETTVSTVSGEPNWNTSETRRYRFDTPGSYQHYRILMTDQENIQGDQYTVYEYSLFDNPWVDISTDPSTLTVVSNQLFLDSDGANRACAEQAVTINETATDHILKFDVVHGPLSVMIGSTHKGKDILDELELGSGRHWIEFNPDGNSTIFIQFFHDENAGRVLDDVEIHTSTVFRLEHPYAEEELPSLRWEQIGDVLYLTHPDHQQRRLERRDHRTWSLIRHEPVDGPYQTLNTGPVTISADDVVGEVTLTSSDDVFVSADAGRLIELTYAGQLQGETANTDDVATGSIKVTGDGSTQRTFNIQIGGVFTGTITLQGSSGNEENWVDVTTYSSTQNVNYNDANGNETWFYRLIVKSGDYTSGTITLTLTYSGGTTKGVVRIITVDTTQSATAEVYQELGSTDAVRTWRRGAWGSDEGWPSAVTSGWGRLWYGSGIKLWTSKSDDFSSFLDGSESDEAFSWTLSHQSTKGIRWLQFLNLLVIGTQSAEQIGLGNTNAEPVGPTNFQTINGSYEGVADIQAIRTENSVLYPHRSLRKLMQLTQNPRAISEDNYISVDLTELAPEILDDRIVKVAVQREPQRRIYVVLRSGIVAELLFRREIEVNAWSIIKTEGRIEDVVVIQQEDEDKIYFIVKREINGSSKRFVEKLGRDYILTDWNDYYLDSALSLNLTRPDTIATPTGTTGSITVTTDDSVFVLGDVGKRIWINGGRGTISSYTSGTSVDVTVTTDLRNTIPNVPTKWGFGEEITAVTGLDHLEGETVSVYGDMSYHGLFTVSGGAITLTTAASAIHVGLPMTSKYKSAKLAYGAQKGTALGQKKGIKTIKLMLYRTGEALWYGSDENNLFPVKLRTSAVNLGEPMPLFEGETRELNFDTRHKQDARIYLKIENPSPATVTGYVPSIATYER